MDTIYVIRGRMQEVYSRHSKIINKAAQFILALVVFTLINHNVGFMKALASPVAALGLAIICAFLPLIFTILAATALVLVHMFALSLGFLIVTAIVFLIMYIFYFRLTPKMAFLVLITPVAFFLKVPYVIPVACGLVLTPVSMVAVTCGTIVYYMLEYTKKASASIEGGGKADILKHVSNFAKQVFQNKELWIVIVAFIICCLLVYTLRRQAMDHAWKAAIIAGAVSNIVVIAVGDIALGVHTSYGALIVGSLAAVVIGAVLELFFFTVDYARSENLQFEDDEYYYYVKAVPKISIATPEKTVKRINERQETEIIDTEEVKTRAKSVKPEERQVKRRPVPKKNSAVKRGPLAKKHDMKEVDKMLLTQSLKRDLNLKD